MRNVFLALIALASLSFATLEADELAAARSLILSNSSCASLNQSQLELIGDYYMEQMHPGAAHDAMDRMLGGEGSDSLRAANIQMARVLYCGDTNATVTYGGMMGMMPALYRFGGAGFGGGMMGSGMMGNWGYGMMGDWWWVLGAAFWLLVFAALVLVVIWLYKQVAGGGSESASEVLKRRYAKGEISKKQFEDMKSDLGEE